MKIEIFIGKSSVRGASIVRCIHTYFTINRKIRWIAFRVPVLMIQLEIIK